MSEIMYGSLMKRLKALIIDFIVLMVFGLVASMIFSNFENAPDYARVIVFVFIFFLYDPLFTSIIGCTIGQLMLGLRVRRSNDETKKTILPLAFIRYIFKVMLGWISLLTVSGNSKRMAIHDMIAGTVVIDKTSIEY